MNDRCFSCGSTEVTSGVCRQCGFKRDHEPELSDYIYRASRSITPLLLPLLVILGILALLGVGPFAGQEPCYARYGDC